MNKQYLIFLLCTAFLPIIHLSGSYFGQQYIHSNQPSGHYTPTSMVDPTGDQISFIPTIHTTSSSTFTNFNIGKSGNNSYHSRFKLPAFLLNRPYNPTIHSRIIIPSHKVNNTTVVTPRINSITEKDSTTLLPVSN